MYALYIGQSIFLNIYWVVTTLITISWEQQYIFKLEKNKFNFNLYNKNNLSIKWNHKKKGFPYF
jgi:hypothetical protein